MIVLSSLHNCYSQNINEKSYQIGETITDFSFVVIESGVVKTRRLTDYRKRLLLIDFWATWCNPCFNELPKLAQLKVKYAGEVGILSVTAEEKEKVLEFCQKLKKRMGIDLNTIVEDKTLNNIFRPATIPRYAWLDKDLKIIGLTTADYVTEEGIDYYLKHGKVKGVETVKSNLNVKVEQPLLIKNAQVQLVKGDTIFYHENKLYKSILVKYKPGLMGFIGYYPIDVKNKRIVCANTNLTRIAIAAYAGNKMNQTQKALFQIADSAKRKFAKSYLDQESYPNNCYSYEIISNDTVHTDRDMKLLLPYMQSDIRDYMREFGIDVRIDTVKSQVMVLKRSDSTINLSSQGNGKQFVKNMLFFKGINVPVFEFVSTLRSYYWQMLDLPPLIDKTGYKSGIDFEINAKMSDPADVSRELKRLGLSLHRETMKIERIVFSDFSGN